MKKFALVLLFVLIFSLNTNLFCQELPSNFKFKRETGQKSGLPIFHLMPADENIAYDALEGNTFEALGLLIQPDRNIYSVIFMNAKNRYQFSTNRNKRCSIKIDSEVFKYPKYIPTTKDKVGKLKIEVVGFKITKEVYNKLTKGNDILVTCGVVKYNLDQDNIDAFKYFASEVNKDLERRKKAKK